MTRPQPDKVETACVIGTGLIGASWATLFLANGIAVRASDVSPAGEAHLHKIIERGWPIMERFGLKPGADPSRVSFFEDPAEAVRGAEFVQENVLEKLGLKQDVLAAIDAVLPPDCVLSSSTSGFLPSALQAKCRHPERVVVGHPFNPPYLIPLVEVVGSPRTAPWAMDWACAFYTAIGKRALRLKREIKGFVANRLQAAVFREMIHLAHEDVASMADLDAAIAQGPGLRWAAMGPLLTFHLARQTGFDDFIEDFAGELNQWGLASGSTLVAGETRKRMVEGVLAEAGGRTLDTLSTERDAAVAAFIAEMRRRDLPG